MLHRRFVICSSYRTLHFEILKLKQIFRSNGYPQTFVDRCIKMYLDKVFIKYPNICVMLKYNLAFTLLHHGFMICSSYRTLHFEILKLKLIFRSNGYPQNFVDCCIKVYLNNVFIKHPNICVVPKKELVCVFPFLEKNSLEIKKRLQNAIERTLPYCKLNVIFKSPSKIVNHSHFKNVLPKKLCSGIDYSFKCNSCNAIYYGKTKRHFYVRAAEYMGISHLTNKRLKMSGNQLFQITY